MSVSVQSTSSLGRKVEATIPNQKLQTLLSNRITKLSKEVKLKGFRPGKVPVQVIQKQFGSSVRQEVIAELIEETLKETLVENKLTPAGQPVVEQIKDKEQEDLSFTVTFEIFPEIALADLSNIEINKKVATVTEADVDKMQEKLCRNLGSWLPTDKAAQNGDRLVIDFTRKLDGAESDETQNNVKIELGHATTLPGLSEKLVGCKVEQTVEFDTTYPEKWAEEKAAGKAVKLNITVKEVQTNEPLTSAVLAERLGLKADDTAALREKIKSRMEDEVNRTLFQGLQEDVLEILLKENNFDLPDVLVQQEKRAIYKESERKNEKAVQALDDTEVNDSAVKRVKLGLLVNEIIKKYNVKADGKRLRKEVEYLAQEFPNPEEIVNIYFSNKQLLSSVERVVLLQQAIESLLKDMKLVEKSVSFDEVMNPEN